MIRFDQEDSDPYTHILIYEDDEIKSGSFVAFSLYEFESWLNKQVFPQSVKEAAALIEEYDALVKKSADADVQRIMAGINKEEAGSYDQRYARLKSRGVSEHEIHTKLFPEEYDFIYDDHVDAAWRRQGVNPMNQDYTERTNARRVAGGFSPFGSDGGDQ